MIRLGIGDVTRPLCQCAGEALLEGAKEMMSADTFKGYGPEQGYEDTRKAIVDYYKRSGVEIDASAVFVSDGAKSDTGNITDLFAHDNVILIPTPVYPVYVDSNVMCGNKVEYIEGNADNDFLPMPDWDQHADIIYICSPNNPTGACYNKSQLKEWVDYALKNQAVILFDAAYEAFVSDSELPRSIYAVEGQNSARLSSVHFPKQRDLPEPDVDIPSFPRNWYLQRPQEKRCRSMLCGTDVSAQNTMVLPILYRKRQRQCSVRKASVSAGRIWNTIGRMRESLRIHFQTLVSGFMEGYIPRMSGLNARRTWIPGRFFDYLLQEIQVVGTPGAGFGENGKHYFRLTSFGTYENTAEAMKRFRNLLETK